MVSCLQQDETRYYAIAVIVKNDDHLKIATISWLKERLDSWLARAENQVPDGITIPNWNYTFPTISDGAGCVDGTLDSNVWSARSARLAHGSVDRQ